MTIVLRYLKPYWWQIIILVLSVFAQAWSTLFLPDIMANIVNNGILSRNQDAIWQQGLLMLLVTLVGGLSTVVTGFFAARIGSGFAKDLRQATFEKIESFSINEMSRFSASSLITRSTNDVQQVQQTVTMFLRMVVSAPILAIGAIVRALANAAEMSYIIAIPVAILVALMIVLIVTVMPKFKIIQKLVDKLNLVTRENLTGLRVIRAFNNEGLEEAKFEKVNSDFARINLVVNRIMSLLQPITMLVFNFTTLAIIWVGARFVASEDVEIGNLLAFMQYAIQAISSFLMISMVFVILPNAAVSAGRIAEVLKTKPSIKEPKKAKKPRSKTNDKVEFKNVTFSYHGADAPVLHDVSFKAKVGETTAFVGSTGSGKSTLINLVPRFYDATEGEVLIDGQNVRDYAGKDLIQKIGYIPQKGVLFSGTIKSNIAYGVDEIDQKSIEHAAKISQASSFISKLSKKYESPIAQGGTNVSGGQRQRLSIARAVAKNPEIYIFDDSFSALDYKTDSALRKELKKVTKNSAVLIVAQRINTVRKSDQIIVLDSGKVVGKGTHYELLRKCKVYKDIAQSQMSEDEYSSEIKTANSAKKVKA